MGDSKDDVRQSPTVYGVSNQQGYGSLHGQQLAVRSVTYSQSVGNRFDVKEEEDYEEDDDGDDQDNGVHAVKDVGGSEDDDSDEDDHNEKPKGYDDRKVEYVDLVRQSKKQKTKSLISNYEFAPRVLQPPTSIIPSATKPSSGGRNSLTDWTERETFALLDAWGDRFLQRGRKSLRFEEWQEVVNKVAEVSKIERTDTQCRNRLDTLKKKYKKEKIVGDTSKWIYFKKMDLLISSPSQQTGISCGLDNSGGNALMNPRVYLNRANGSDKVKDSPDDSESTEGDNESDGLPPKKRKSGRDNDEGSPVRLLADCIHKFSAMYEKIESSKRKQMVELEKMRMDFLRDMEMQKRRIMENATAEFAKMCQRNDGNENTSG